MRDVQVELEPAASGRLQVTLLLGVEVRGGWLERLELSGFEEDLVLDATEPAWLDGDGDAARVLPSAEARGGTIALRFDKQAAPRRGLHRLGVRYTSALVAEPEQWNDSSKRLRWTLPGWESGLSDSAIRWLLPRGAAPVADAALAQGLESTRLAERQSIRFARVHVPRGSPWTVAVDVPRGDRQAQAPSGLVAPARPRRSWGAGVALALLALGLSLAARAHVRRRARALGFATQPRVRAAGAWAAGLALLALLSFPQAQALALVALTALGLVLPERVVERSAPLGLGHFEPIGAREQRSLHKALRLAWLGRAPWADGASVIGLLGAGACVAGAAVVPGALDPEREAWGLGVVCALVSWVASARVRLPRSVEERVEKLKQAALRARCAGCGLRLVWYAAGSERAEPRLRATPSARYAGLLRVEVLAEARRDLPALALSAVVVAGSPTDRWLRRLWGEASRRTSQGGVRASYLRPIDDAGPALDELLEGLARASQATLELLVKGQQAEAQAAA